MSSFSAWSPTLDLSSTTCVHMDSSPRSRWPCLIVPKVSSWRWRAVGGQVIHGLECGVPQPTGDHSNVDREWRRRTRVRPIAQAVVGPMILSQAHYTSSTRIVGLAACIALLIASCSSTTESTTASSATTTATSSAVKGSALKTIDPKAFQAVVEAAVEKLKVPGAMVVLRTPQGNFDAAVGTTEVGRQTPPDANTHFRIASNTKTMTAALIVLLAQDGRLKFTDPVSTYVPDVPNGKNITVAELLKMRSGLYDYTADPALSAAMDAD